MVWGSAARVKVLPYPALPSGFLNKSRGLRPSPSPPFINTIFRVFLPGFAALPKQNQALRPNGLNPARILLQPFLGLVRLRGSDPEGQLGMEARAVHKASPVRRTMGRPHFGNTVLDMDRIHNRSPTHGAPAFQPLVA
jgi:hypothetical protein